MVGPRYSEEDARHAIAQSRSYAEALRRLGMCPAGGNHATLRKYADRIWGIPTDHFDPYAGMRGVGLRPAKPLEEILVANSTYSRGKLKDRLYAAGLKDRRCELCGQGEIWRGRRMSLILDHVNGVATDNRLENLRIVCPNCAATLDTHCGRNVPRVRSCVRCSRTFTPKAYRHRYCSVTCGQANQELLGIPRPDRRKVQRPPYEQLLEEVEELGYLAVGRRHGVSDNAIRKWIRWYKRQRERESASAGESERRDAA